MEKRKHKQQLQILKMYLCYRFVVCFKSKLVLDWRSTTYFVYISLVFVENQQQKRLLIFWCNPGIGTLDWWFLPNCSCYLYTSEHSSAQSWILLFRHALLKNVELLSFSHTTKNYLFCRIWRKLNLSSHVLLSHCVRHLQQKTVLFLGKLFILP